MIDVIEIVIEQGTPASQWHRLALKRARAAAQERGIEWVAAKVFVRLPENNRCFTKTSGYTQFVAHN